MAEKELVEELAGEKPQHFRASIALSFLDRFYEIRAGGRACSQEILQEKLDALKVEQISSHSSLNLFPGFAAFR